MGVLETKVFRMIETHFYNYRLIKKAVELEKERLIKSSGLRGFSDGARGNRTSDPVGTRGALLADIPKIEILTPGPMDITNPERWLIVVEATRENYENTLLSDMIEKRYISHLDINAVCAKIQIDRATYYAWRDKVITFAALCATQVKLIKILA